MVYHGSISLPCLIFVSLLGPYYTMRFHFVAFAIRLNANEMNMQRKYCSTYITLKDRLL